MNVTDAAYHTVHDFPGGAEALAPRLGKRGTSLCHEVRPQPHSQAKLGLSDALKIMQITGDYRILHAMAQDCGFVVVPLPDAGGRDGGTLEHCATVAKEFAELMGEVAQDVSDGRITDNEMARIERAWGEQVQATQGLLAHLRRLNAAGKPPALRPVLGSQAVAA